MEILIQDTSKLYEEMLALPDSERLDFFKEKLMQPFLPAFEQIHMPIAPETLGCLPLNGSDAEANEMLSMLKEANAWGTAQKAMEAAAERFINAGIEIPERVVVGIFLGNPEVLAQSQGYTGMGSVPGYIQILIAPNEYNLPRLAACIAHEFHHNVLFFNAKWNFINVTLGKYLAVEGLAESFATSLFGEQNLGPWVTGIQSQDLERSRVIIGKNLDAEGFMEVRKYMYGDHPMVPEAKDLGIPYCGGYAVGYHAVQAFIKKTGVSAEKATIIDGDEIMKLSDYFYI
jgi:uncharacterized protein YjaZ